MFKPKYKIILATDLNENSVSAEVTIEDKDFMRIYELNGDKTKLFIEFNQGFHMALRYEDFKEILFAAKKRILK